MAEPVKNANSKPKTKSTSKKTTPTKSTTKNPGKSGNATANAKKKKDAQIQAQRRKSEIFGIVLISLGIFFALTLTNTTGIAGQRISGFAFGLFGFVYYLFSVIFIAYGIFTIASGGNYRIAKNMIALMLVICVMSLIHLKYVDSLAIDSTYFQYLAKSFRFSEVNRTGGGLFGAFVSLPVKQFLGSSASYLLFITLILIDAIVLTNLSLRQAGAKVGKAIMNNLDIIQQKQSARQAAKEQQFEDFDEQDYSFDVFADDDDYSDDEEIGKDKQGASNFVMSQDEQDDLNRKRESDGGGKTSRKSSRLKETLTKKRRSNYDFPDFVEGELNAHDAVRKDNFDAKVRPIEAMPSTEGRNQYEKSDWDGFEEIPVTSSYDDPEIVDRWYDVREDLPYDQDSEIQSSDAYNFEVSGDYGEYDDEFAFADSDVADNSADTAETSDYNPKQRARKSPKSPEIFNILMDSVSAEGTQQAEIEDDWPDSHELGDDGKKKTSDAKLTASQRIQAERDQKETEGAKKTTKKKAYAPPPLKCLTAPERRNTTRDNPRAKAKKLEETLSSFGISAEVVEFAQGPVITRFELRPAPGVRVNRIANLSDDLALNLAAKSVRIEAPIPGKAAVGIEVPNRIVTPVTLRELIALPEFKNNNSKISVALGRDIAGKLIVADIAKMPHLLIAGATGSGKSVCINTIICSFLYHSTPDDVKLILIDPKVVELASFNLVPHLLIPVVTDPKKAASSLNWAVHEMLERYQSFASHGARDLARYNAIAEREGEEKLPQIVVVIDELADLMMVAPDDVEDAICRIAQMGRAAGIHLIVATQRPSSDIITGLIKANIPSRIAFAVASGTDSRIILDRTGAEKLLGKGDMLYYPIGATKPIRVQGALVTDSEIESIKEHFQTMYGSNAPQFDQKVFEDIETGKDFAPQIKNKGKASEQAANDTGFDELLPEAVEMLMQVGHASISMVQRRHRIGYNRAARMVDQMEHLGIVSAADGSKPRNILIDRGGFERIFGYPPNIAPMGS